MKAVHASAALALLLAVVPASAQNVKITPLGSHPGELCASDRATIFEEKPGLLGSQDAGAASRAVFAAKFGGTP